MIYPLLSAPNSFKFAVLGKRKGRTNSRWMFPSPSKANSPLDPATCRKRLQTILKHAQCKQVRFHDLRHTFSTMALENGMDVKTLSAVIGHVGANTTLNIYTHITGDMQKTAAAKIDRGIGRGTPASQSEKPTHNETDQAAPFQPYKGKIRKRGTGCVTKINDHLWEDRYTPPGLTASVCPATSTPTPRTSANSVWRR